MADWKDNKDSGPWDFTEQPNKWGYLNNPRWSNQQDSVDFCKGLGLEAGSLSEHKPCGHWHKSKYSSMIPGKWVAAMQQPGTPYIYLYNIGARAVIRVNTAFVPPIIDGILRLNSAYALDYDMGWGNPGAQRGAYCMNKDGTRIWYLFCGQGQYPIVRGHPDAELIEVDITSYYMKVVKKTLFPSLLPADPFPGPNAGRVNDSCSDDTYTYWCTELIAGRIIKIRNSDHVIVDDHTFNYPIEGCGAGFGDSSITIIDADKNNKKLYWAYTRDHSGCIPPYSACQHIIRANTDLIADIDNVFCGTGLWSPEWQNMIRLYGNHILHHRAYHPSFSGFISKRLLTDCAMLGDEVVGTDTSTYTCIRDHVAVPSNKPITGALWDTYWVHTGSDGDIWILGEDYSGCFLQQEYLQNILGVKNNKLFTLMHVNSLSQPAFLYCINFNDMDEISRLDVSYYAGQIYPPGGYAWDRTSVSAMNQQTGVIAIFRYHNEEERNYAGCFNADSALGLLCDARFERIYDDPTLGPFGEPQLWIMPSDEIPEPAGGEDIGNGYVDGGTMCVGQTPRLSQNSISISTMEGSDAANRSIRITDNCSNPLAFQIEEVNNNSWITWISSPVIGNTGNGILNINFNITSLSAGNYNGSIIVSTSLGNLTLNINLVITSSPDYGEATGTILIKGDTPRTFDFNEGEIKLFKFIANSGPSSPTLTITVKQLHHASLDFLVKYSGQNWEAGPPTESDHDNVVAAIEIDPYAYPPHMGLCEGIYYYRSRFHVMDAPSAYSEDLGFNCPFPPGHHSYCTVCKEFLKCKAGEGWCSSNRGHCAPGLICDEEVHKCVVPVYTKQIVINYPSPIANGCWYLWMKNFRSRDLNDNKIYFDFS